MVDWYLGTMGFSWKDWEGPFYPPGLESRDYLSYYSKIFNAVEIDSTFYGVPRPETVERWAAETEPGFCICAKLPKEITHERPLREARPMINAFLEVIRLLREELGVILAQFPPSFTVESFHDLETFLGFLPEGTRFALEVRHRSWYTPKGEELLIRALREHQVALAATEYLHLPKRIERTAPFLYVRFIGQHGRFPAKTGVKIDVRPQLEWWREQILAHLDVPEPPEAVYGFFNNDYSGFSPATLNQFKEMLGLPVQPFTPPEQAELF